MEQQEDIFETNEHGSYQTNKYVSINTYKYKFHLCTTT